MTRLLYLHYADPTPFLKIFDRVQPFHKIKDLETIGEDDVILYGGGTDVNPTYYNQKKHPLTQMSDEWRDEFEYNVYETFKGKVKGFIGICRGAQYLTVLNGGKLIQHIGNRHCYNHPIVDKRNGKEVVATSVHHQLCYPFDLDKSKYEIIATPPENIARIYEEENYFQGPNTVECEPEVIWFPEHRGLAIQGHPEFQRNGMPYNLYCRDLVVEKILEGK